MSHDMTSDSAMFERMTKEEKLRFCQDLIKQAANLTKSPNTSGIHSPSIKSTSRGIRSTSKSSKRPASTSHTLSKKTKSGRLSHDERSKSNISKQSASKSSMKSSKSHRVRVNLIFICTEIFICVVDAKITDYLTATSFDSSEYYYFKISLQCFLFSLK